MTDNTNGTYSAQYTPTVEGTVTLIAFLLTKNKVYVQFYADKIFTPPAALNTTWSSVYQDWNTGNIFTDTQSTPVSYDDDISASIHFLIKPSVHEDYTFYLESNDGSDLYINNTIQISKLGTNCSCDDNFDINLKDGEYAEFK